MTEPIKVRGTPPAGRSVGSRPRTRAAKRAVEDPGFVTLIEVDDVAGQTTTVAEVLARSLGVNVRSLGGLGGFSSISIRGATAGHTAVLVDGIPLSRLASVTADLSRFELRSFGELEVYRGGVPPELGGAALGGALNLITGVGRGKQGERLLMSMGAGSFGARHLRGAWRDDVGRGGIHVSLGYAGASGNFPFFSDNGTNLNPDDDGFVSRTNNQFDRVDLVARYGTAGHDLATEAGMRVAFKQQGVPGSQSVQTMRSRLTTVNNLVDFKLTKHRPLGRRDSLLALIGYGLVESQQFADPDGEVGLAMQDRALLTFSGGLMGRFSGAVGHAHVLSAGAELGVDVFNQRDALSERASGGHRLRAAITASDDYYVGGERWLLQPALRLDVMTTSAPAALDGPTLTAPASRADLYPSPRLSTRVRVSPSLAVKANAGWYFRAPTSMELFGDRGYIVGNPELRAETGMSADLGMVFAAGKRHGVFDRLYAEAAVFGSRPRNTIVLTPTAGLAVVPQNLGDATIYGAELAGTARVGQRLALAANYTFLDSRQQSPLASYDGKRLPQRPRHQVYGRVELTVRPAGRRLMVWTDALIATGNFLDPANLNQVPRRLLFGGGVKLEPVPWLLVGLEAKNLTDRRVEMIALDPAPRPDLSRVPRPIADFFGYPLPGRAIYVTVDLRL